MFASAIMFFALGISYGAVLPGPAGGAACSSYLLIGSRGSGDPITKNEGLGAPGEAFAQAARPLFPGLTVIANPYSAIPVTGGWRAYVNAVGALVRQRLLGAYDASAEQGEQLLRQLILREIRDCPTTKILLSGYSQGAQVTGDVVDSLSYAQKTHLQGVVLFGDPRFYAGQGGGPGGLNQGDYSPHRNGILGKRLVSVLTAGGLLSFCHDGDPICQAGQFVFAAHLNYDKLGEPEAAARFFMPHSIVVTLSPAGGVVITSFDGIALKPVSGGYVFAEDPRRVIGATDVQGTPLKCNGSSYTQNVAGGFVAFGYRGSTCDAQEPVADIWFNGDGVVTVHTPFGSYALGDYFSDLPATLQRAMPAPGPTKSGTAASEHVLGSFPCGPYVDAPVGRAPNGRTDVIYQVDAVESGC